jgi:hypothetical protein
MYKSMPHVVGTALAAVDALENGSSLKIMTFDDNVREINMSTLNKEAVSILPLENNDSRFN